MKPLHPAEEMGYADYYNASTVSKTAIMEWLRRQHEVSGKDS